MRYLFGFICVLALGLMGCSETAGTGGSGGDAGSGGGGGEGGQGGVGGGTVACADNVCPCTEAGIRAAIAEGGGPFTFDCDGATTVVSQAPIEIDNGVILNGAGEVTVDGDNDHHVFTVPEGVTAELQGFTVTNGVDDPSISGAGGIRTSGRLMLINCTVSGNTGRWMAGIGNGGSLTLNNSTVSDNTGIGIYNAGPGTLTLNNSTVSGNDGNGIAGDGNTTLIDSTVSGNSAISGGGIDATGGPMSFSSGPLTLINSTVSGNTAEQGGGGIVGG